MQHKPEPGDAGHVFQCGIREMAIALDKALEAMHKRNDETDFVLAGLRRNGFLALRPDKHGRMKTCDHEDWAADKPLGSNRVHEKWLRNRYVHVHDEGARIEPPNWERIHGAKELADVVYWSYTEDMGAMGSGTACDMEVCLGDEPEWQQMAQFQLPLSMRRAMMLREHNMSEHVKKKRDRRAMKQRQRNEGREATKKVREEDREALRSELQQRSRHAILMAMPAVASVRGQAPMHKKKKMSQMKTDKKQCMKGMKKSFLTKAAMSLKKKQQAEAASHEAASHEAAPPLPPPAAPPAGHGAEREALPAGKYRVTDEAWQGGGGGRSVQFHA